MSNTEVIKLPRGCGKTTTAIQYAQEHNLPLIVINSNHVKEITRKYPNLNVIAFNKFDDTRIKDLNLDTIVVDNLDVIFDYATSSNAFKIKFIEWFLDTKIELATVNDYGESWKPEFKTQFTLE